MVLYDYANHPHLAQDLPGVDEYRVMPSFYFFSAGSHCEARARKFADEIDDLMRTYGGDDRRLGIDRLSFMPCDSLREKGLVLIEGEGIAERARAVKSQDELALMQVSMNACEAACDSMREALEPGITENALWAKMHETNIRMGGEWVETRLLSSGPRTNPWFQECGPRIMQEGDMMAFDTDLVGTYGYCCDISRSWIVGDVAPTEEQKTLYKVAYEHVMTNIGLIKPGMSFAEMTAKAHRLPEEYRALRYGVLAHGVGLCDEYPCVRYPEDVEAHGYSGTFEPGMTLCVEAYIGAVGGLEGVKLEEQVLITETGCETLSTYRYEDALLA